MLGKLIKYEFKATSRTFLPLYGLLLIVATIHRLFGRDNRGNYMELNQIGDVATLLIVALFIALGVLTLVVTIQRFSKNLLGDEGYLMFTLPTSSRKLILSKVILAMTWIIVSGMVGVLTFGILFIDPTFLDQLGYIMAELSKQLEAIDLLLAAQVIVLGLMNYAQFLLVIYFALCIGHLPPFQKHRTAIGLITFILTNVVIGWVLNLMSIVIPPTLDDNIIFFILSLISLIVTVGLFEGVHYILQKHLNLE